MIATIGLDLAKDVFQVHAADAKGRLVLRQQLRRHQMADWFAKVDPCVVGMEACCSAHHWARTLQAFGHTVRLMAPQFVKPYVKSQKNDVADAEAIAEAVTRPTMRFVPIKSLEQQAILSVHRVRQGFVQARCAQSNQLRSLLGEFGIVLPVGLHHLRRIPALLDGVADTVPGLLRELILTQLDYVRVLDRRLAELEAMIRRWHRASPDSRRLAEVPGIGPLTATALVGSIGNAQSFANGRQFAAWIGLVPRQRSSGGKAVLLGVTKRGDRYLRTLLVHGARSVMVAARRKPDFAQRWLGRLAQRRHVNVAIVAQANKNARVAWAILRHRDRYDIERCEATAH